MLKITRKVEANEKTLVDVKLLHFNLSSSNVELMRRALTNINRPVSPNFKPLKSKDLRVKLFINIEDKADAVSGTHLHQFNPILVKLILSFNPSQIASIPIFVIRKFPRRDN